MQAAQLRWIKWGALGLILAGLGIICFFWFGPGKVTAATFEPRGDSLVMRGVITKTTPRALEEAREEFPGLTRIIMEYVPGSVNDVANLEAAQMVRAHHLKAAPGLAQHCRVIARACRDIVARGGADPGQQIA